MALSALQVRDRNEWLQKLAARVKREKVVTITLRAGGASLSEVLSAVGKGVESKVDGNSVTLAVVQAVEPTPATPE